MSDIRRTRQQSGEQSSHRVGHTAIIDLLDLNRVERPICQLKLSIDDDRLPQIG
jgi:hypothetical protein